MEKYALVELTEDGRHVVIAYADSHVAVQHQDRLHLALAETEQGIILRGVDYPPEDRRIALDVMEVRPEGEVKEQGAIQPPAEDDASFSDGIFHVSQISHDPQGLPISTFIAEADIIEWNAKDGTARLRRVRQIDTPIPPVEDVS